MGVELVDLALIVEHDPILPRFFRHGTLISGGGRRLLRENRGIIRDMPGTQRGEGG